MTLETWLRRADRPVVARAVQGLALSVGAPAGWLLLRLLQGNELGAAISSDPGVYLYMLFGTALAFSAFGAYVGRQEERARWMGLRDAETGFYSAGYFLERLREACEQPGLGQGLSVALMVFDLPDLGLLRDRHGYRVEAELLSAIGRAVATLRRPGEHVGRLRARRLAVLVEGSGMEDAQLRALMQRYASVIQGARALARHGKLVGASVRAGLAVTAARTEDGYNQLLHDAVRAARAAAG
jgi:GGDEF domain-containing protein